jgi:hypothetical protein
MSSIPVGIQRFGGMSTVTHNGVAHSEPPPKEFAMSRMSVLKHAINTATAGLVFVAMLSPAHAAAYQHESVGVYPDLPVSASAGHAKVKTPITRNASIALTSHRPWRAPVGHFQPRRDEVPQPEEVSEWERQQKQFNEELDRRLIICRGC